MDIIELLAWTLGATLLVGLVMTFIALRMSQVRVHALSDLLSGFGFAMVAIGGAGLLFILTNWPPK